MKKLSLLTILALISGYVPSAIFAEETQTEETKLRIVVPPTNRKRAPAQKEIECYYQGGVVTIEFEIPEGDAVFTVTDVVTGDNASTTFNTAMEFNYYIGSEPSTYLLEVSTSAGNDYEGYLTID